MAAPHRRRPRRRSTPSDERFRRASELWDRGELRPAFRLFLAAAKDGDESCQLNVGYFYDEGLGVRKSIDKALHWYRRAYRKGNASAAANIGLILRKRGEARASLEWLLRALRKGDHDSALHLGETYLSTPGDLPRAIRYLKLAATSKKTTEATRERASTLLKEALRRRESGRGASGGER